MSSEARAEITTEPSSAERHRRGATSIVLILMMLGVGVRTTRFGAMGSPSVSEMLVVLAACLVVAHALLFPNRSIIRIDGALKYFGAFVLWASASYFWAYHPEVVAGEVIAVVLKAVTYGLIIACTIDRTHLQHWGHLFILMSIAFAATAVHEGGAGGPAGFEQAGQALGGWSWINQLGKWSCLFLPFNIHYIVFGRSRVIKLLAGLGIVGNLLTVYLISRRAPLLIITLELILFAILFKQYRKTLLGITLLLVLSLPLLVLSNPGFAERIALTALEINARLSGQEFEFGSVRLMQYQASIAAIKEHYLVGLGLGSLRFWTHEVYGFRIIFWPHSLILQLLGELGIPGFLLFAGFILNTINRGLRTQKRLVREERLEEASLLTAMICAAIGLVIYGQFQPIFTEMHLYLSMSVLSAAAFIYASPPPAETAEEPAASAI